MVIAAAKAIAAQLRLVRKNNQLAMANNKLMNFFNMVSDAVIVLDRFGKVAEINPAVEKVLARPGSEMIGHPLYQLLDSTSDKNEISRLLNGQTQRMGKELTFTTQKGPCSCLVSTEPIIDEHNDVAGSFITLHPVKAVQNLVHRYSGYMASLQFSDIIGESREIKEAVELARLSAESASNVLLQGESGTGKEIFAQAIHNQSPRRKGPFIPLNCGAIPRELVGSELFGYEEGAFTGAKKQGKPGKFELASGGTLFLDEIGDMPLEHQAVLLRVIQEKRMSRIGGIKVIPVDVRLICATHKNLLEKVRQGTFRQDLYYRLNVMSITIPPLRERKEDIPKLFQYFLDSICSDRAASITVDSSIMPYLFSYPWPGNVRELQNVVERAVNLALNGVIGPNQLPEEVCQRMASKTRIDINFKEPPLHINLHHHRQQKHYKEKQELLVFLDRYSGNISKVAKELGISRKTVYNRLHRHNIRP
jgi:transcriptional regulator with PAS, ATPase and Fis domain